MGAMKDLRLGIEFKAFDELTALGIYTGTPDEFESFQEEVLELEEDGVIIYEGFDVEIASNEIVNAIY